MVRLSVRAERDSVPKKAPSWKIPRRSCGVIIPQIKCTGAWGPAPFGTDFPKELPLNIRAGKEDFKSTSHGELLEALLRHTS